MLAHSASGPSSWGRDGMVATSVGPAAAAGQEILARGGNAVDAAVATAFAAAVAHPFSSGLGGGLFAVVHEAETGEAITLDARETAPAGASADWYGNHPDTIRRGHHSVGVPGFVQGVYALHQRFGSLPWKELIEPAIALAADGVEVGDWHHNMVSRVAPALKDYPETANIQLLNGQAPPLGWKLKQQDLAATLKLIQDKGEKALAVGEVASKIQTATKGAVTELDLARYQVKWRQPIRGNYRGYEIISMPPSSSGGVLLVQMLNILQRYDLTELGKNSSRYVHTLASAMKLAFADRARYLGDMDYHPVPVERLISMEYADQQAARIKPGKQVEISGVIKQIPDDGGTTHISVMDRNGNAVALTQTINTLFGSLITVPGTGIVLNNELDDFALPGEIPNAWGAIGGRANAVAPGKRPLSSMTPTIVLKDGRPYFVAGSPMGTTIISSVLHSLINAIDFGFHPQRAVMAPRFHHQWQPDVLRLEPEFPSDVRQQLQQWGYQIGEIPFMGAVQLIQYNPETCYFRGGADGRRDSLSLGVNTEASAGAVFSQQCAARQAQAASVVP